MIMKTNSCSGPLLRLSALSQSAQADQVEVRQVASWDNSVDVDLSWSVDISKVLNIGGSISIFGFVFADALAQATLDDKQIVDGNSVVVRGLSERLSGLVHRRHGRLSRVSARVLAIRSTLEEGAPQGPATYTDTVTARAGTLGNASGNIGLNMAAGDYNVQENAAVIASAESDFLFFGSGAAEQAGSFALQNLYNNVFNNPENGGGHSAELENTDVDNTVAIGDGLANGADGNIGVNGAAGAFNIQKNALVIATVTGRSRRSHGRHAAGRRRQRQRRRRRDQRRLDRRLADWRFGQYRRQPRVGRRQSAAQHAHDCERSEIRQAKTLALSPHRNGRLAPKRDDMCRARGAKGPVQESAPSS